MPPVRRSPPTPRSRSTASSRRRGSSPRNGAGAGWTGTSPAVRWSMRGRRPRGCWRSRGPSASRGSASRLVGRRLRRGLLLRLLLLLLRRLLLLLLLARAVVAHRAADGRTGHAMLAGDVAGDTANGGALGTSLGLR